MLIRYLLLSVLLVTQLLSTHAFCKQTPHLLLAQNYQQGADITQYLISEKLDGVRAFWDGKQLITRQGNKIIAPNWFTKDFPKVALDGELWLARGQFDTLSGTVRKDTPVDAEWKNISYQIFELPHAPGTFEARANV